MALPDLDDEQVMGPSTKWARATLPKQGESAEIKDEWRQHLVDMLEIVNAEHHMMWTQLEGVCQAWDAMNIKLCSIGSQLGGSNQGLQYLAGMVWKRYAVTQGNLASRQAGSSSEGVTRQEKQEAGMGTSEEVVEATVGGYEGTKDQGEGLSGLTTADKGKGKEVQEEEETLQEE